MDEAKSNGLTAGRRHRLPWILGGAVVLLVVGGVVAFGYFGVHTLFIDDVVDEEGPVFDSGVAADQHRDEAPDEPATEVDEPATEVEEPGAEEPVVMTIATGAFEGVGRYSGAGTASVLTDGSEQRFLRFEEDFATDNGPDLLVYLGTGSGDYSNPDEYIELGVLRGNIGSQNYEIPSVHPETGEPIDLDVFDHAAVWCKRFDATFAVAMLA